MSEEHTHHHAQPETPPHHVEFKSTHHHVEPKPFTWLKPALIVVALALVGAGAYSLYEYNAEKQAQKAAAEIGAAILGKEGKDRLSALEGLLSQNLGASKSYVLLEAARTAQSMKDFAKAAEFWSKLESSSDASLSALAVLGKAAAQSQAGDNATALTTLKTFAPKCPKPFELVLMRQMAVAAEATGDISLAVSSYEKMLSAANVQTKSYLEDKIASLKQGLATEKKGS